MTKFDQIYQNILKNILKDGVEETSTLQKVKTKALPGVHFQIDIEKEGFPLLTLRTIPVKLFVAEQIWFISGARKPADFLRDYTKIWDEFTNPNDVITVAYGYRWRKHFGRDQLGLLVDLLKKEPLSRHGVVVTWDPKTDGLSLVKKANVPCPYTFTVNIIGGRLHLHNIVRSNDMYLGFPSDVAGFALLQCILAQKLGYKVGVYSHSISNAHIYENQFEVVQKIVKVKNNHKQINFELPKNSFDRAEKKDKKLADEMIEIIKSKYNPLPNMQAIKIVTWNDHVGKKPNK
jgi:thymidylate synthase